MLKPIFEGYLDIHVKSNTELVQGQVVKLVSEGVIEAAGAGDKVHGLVAQHVVPGNIDNFMLDSVTHKAAVGRDKVGVYFGGGEYYTDQYSGNITASTDLYAGAGGKLVATVSGNVVARAQNDANSANGDKLRIILL